MPTRSPLSARDGIEPQRSDGRRREGAPALQGHAAGRQTRSINGGEGGIRTLGSAIRHYGGLANRCFQPLSHLSARLPCVGIGCAGTELPHGIVTDAPAASNREKVLFRVGDQQDGEQSHEDSEQVPHQAGTKVADIGNGFGDRDAKARDGEAQVLPLDLHHS